MLEENKPVDVDDFISAAKEYGCDKIKHEGSFYIGNPPKATNYPHLHIFPNGKTNLSVGHSINETVGTDWTIDPEKLRQACERFSEKPIAAPLKLAIDWVLNPERDN